MADNDRPVHLDTEEARAGATPGVTRYVLGISLPLIIIVFFIIYFVIKG